MTRRSETLEGFTPYLMNRIMARYNKGVEETLKGLGLTVGQMRALAVLSESGPCTVNELSVLTVIKQSTLSRTLDSLERAGLITREGVDGDNRVRRIALTPEGAALHAQAWPTMLGMKDTMLAALSEDERATLNRLLQTIFYDIRHHDF